MMKERQIKIINENKEKTLLLYDPLFLMIFENFTF